MKKLWTLIPLMVSTVFLSGAGDTPDVSTSFETEPAGDFTLGTAPKTVTFEGGNAQTLGIQELYHSGLRSWMVTAGQTGTITFETPAQCITLWFRDQSSSVNGRLTFLDEEGMEVASFDGNPNQFEMIDLQDVRVKTITLEHQGDSNHTLIDDFSFLAAEPEQEPVFEVVDRFFFPLFADGLLQNIKFQSSIFLANTQDDALIDLEIFGRDAAPLPTTFNELGTDSSFLDIPLARGQALALETPGSGPLSVGYVVVTVKREQAAVPQQESSDAGVGGTAVFTRSEADSEIVLFEAGVPASREITNLTVFLDSRSARDIGLALLNPPEASQTPQEDRSYTITVWDVDFASMLAGPIEVPLSSGEAIGQFIWEIFDGAGADDETVQLLRETQGIVTIEGTAAAVTLRQNDDGQGFPLSVPTLTTFPVIPGTADSTNGQQQ